MSDDLIKALQKEAQEDAEIITFLRAENEKLNVALHGCLKEANKAADEITRLRAENEKLRAALANSELPCVYCTLPKEEWGKCEMGFPGCSRADDAMGCPELGARMEAYALRADLATALAECERLNKSRNRWGKKYNDCLGKLRLAVMSDSDYVKEIDYQNTRFRAENEKLREAVQLLISTQEEWERSVEKIIGKQPNIFLRAIDRARAAFEGVTEPASPWRDIESAPRDGTKILALARSHTDYYGVAEWAEANPDFQRSVAGWFWAFAIRPTHWMPLPEPPR